MCAVWRPGESCEGWSAPRWTREEWMDGCDDCVDKGERWRRRKQSFSRESQSLGQEAVRRQEGSTSTHRREGGRVSVCLRVSVCVCLRVSVCVCLWVSVCLRGTERELGVNVAHL